MTEAPDGDRREPSSSVAHHSTLPIPEALTSGERRPRSSSTHRPITSLGLRGIADSEDLADQLRRWQPCLIAAADARYDMQGLLGRGGQGLVFGVSDLDTGRVVALKTLRADRDQPRHAERFVHEAQVIAQLEHPGVVPIHDLGALPDGTLFYTMKRVGGTTLQDAMLAPSGTRERRFELLQIFLKLCDTMAFAHARGVVHRDLKPSNVMVGDFGEVLVVDWGLSKVLPGSPVQTVRTGLADVVGDDPASESDTLTHVGHALGTPGYMSPEQAMALHHAVDQRSDVYSLGVILYEILTGRSPYAAEGTPALMEACARDLVVPVREAAPDVPRPLAAVVEQAMSSLQEQRYFTAAELAADVRRHLAGRAVLAYREGGIERGLRFARRHRTPLLSMAVVVVLAIGIATTLGILRDRERSRRIDEFHERAVLALDEGDLESASAAYERILALDPDDTEALAGSVRIDARIADRREREAEAMAADRARSKATTLIEESRSLALRGTAVDLEQAAALLAQASTILPNEDRERRAAVLAERDALQERLSDHRWRERRRQAEHHLEAARVHAGAGRWSHARGELRLAEELVPADAALRELEDRISRGEIAAEQARLIRLARDELERATQLRVEGQLDEAMAAVRASLRITPLAEAPPMLETLSALREQEREAKARAQREARARSAFADAQPLIDRIDALAADISASRDEQASEVETLVARRLEAIDRAFALLHRAHHLAPEIDQIRLALVDFYRDRVLEAEAAGRQVEASSAAAQGLLLDREDRYPLLFLGQCEVETAAGELTLHSLAGGETVTVASGGARRVAAGRYEVETAAGLRYARRLRRGQRTTLPDPVAADLPEDLIQIVGGPVFGERGLRLAEVDGFAIARHEVTCREWQVFLNATETQRRLARQEQGPLALEPRASWDAERGLWHREHDVFGNAGRFELSLADGDPLAPRAPVMGISHRDVTAYLAWRRERDGLAWRLPTAEEWRLAAQGGDGRRFPWGEREDLSICYSLATAGDRGYDLREVGSFPADRTVAGVLDLGGSVAEFTATRLPDRPAVVVVCGGSFASGDPRAFTSSAQRAVDERWTSTAIGLRLAVSLIEARPEPYPDPAAGEGRD